MAVLLVLGLLFALPLRVQASPTAAPATATAALPFELESLAHEPLAAQIAWFSGPGRRQAAALIARAGLLRPELEAVFDATGAPHELIWVAALESGFDPKAGSRAGAAGLWQFVPVAADSFNLARNGRVDERRHVRASTEAAARLLTDLRREFGSWPLALAAYNMGPYGLRERLAGQTPTDFWTFERNGLLPGSVRRYAARILALAVVAADPERYGLAGLQLSPAREVVAIDVPAPMTVLQLAEATATSAQRIRALNPWLLGSRVEVGDTVYLPPAALSSFRAATPTAGQPSGSTARGRYGEEVDDLAERFGTRAELLRQWNGWPSGFEPEYETEFILPPGASEQAITDRPVVTLPALAFTFPDRKRWFYRVNRRDTLSGLAERLNLPAADIALWNDLDPKLPLRSASMLAIWLPEGFNDEGIRLWAEAAVEVASSPGGATSTGNKARSRPAPSRHTRKTHSVKAGETLSEIARHYRVRVSDLRRWNDLDADEVILVGQPLLVGR